MWLFIYEANNVNKISWCKWLGVILVSTGFSLNLFQVIPLHMHATSIHTFQVIGYLTSKCKMYSTNYTWELLSFWFLLKETVSVCLKTWTPHHPSSHTLCRVCPQVWWPLSLHWSTFSGPRHTMWIWWTGVGWVSGALGEVGISRYEGIEEVGGGLTSKDTVSLSVFLSL